MYLQLFIATHCLAASSARYPSMCRVLGELAKILQKNIHRSTLLDRSRLVEKEVHSRDLGESKPCLPIRRFLES